MGDQIGTAVKGTLYYAAKDELERIAGLNLGASVRTALFADICRLNTLYLIARAGSGHVGSSFSAMDIVSWLYLNELGEDDLYFSSKGHDCPSLYAVLIALGRLAEEQLHQLRRLGGLPGHPDVSTPGVAVNSGSLGMGISKAKGMITAHRMKGQPGRVFVLTGDGELQEGQIWESLAGAVHRKMGELTVIVDHNKYQSDHRVEKTSGLGDVIAKFTAFGWHVERLDGHDLDALDACLARLKAITDTPKVIVADTIKGRGVSFMEHTALSSGDEFYRYHSGAPTSEEYRRGVQELFDRINGCLGATGAAALTIESLEPPMAPVEDQSNMERLIPTYASALLHQAQQNSAIVALDADLVLDTGLISFEEQLPDRFIECGVAEQDMVSQAGGLALEGLLPIAHSFACFLTTRPNEQIYNNATEGTKVIYVGALAGLIPAGPGHSHQSLRDISVLGAVPGMVLLSPACESEVGPLLDYAVNGTDESVYLRLESMPWDIPFSLPTDYRPIEGQGRTLCEGKDAVVFTYGPVLSSQCVRAAELLEGKGLRVKVVNMPWLNRVDQKWLGDTIAGAKAVFTVDNHYVFGGQGALIAAALAASPVAPVNLLNLGIESVPACGQPEEVLKFHGLDIFGLAATIEKNTPEA